MYEPTNAEQGMISRSAVGDVISLAGMILRVVAFGSNGYDRSMEQLSCAWTLGCTGDASELVPHLLLTYVPACEGCAAPVVARYPRSLP